MLEVGRSKLIRNLQLPTSNLQHLLFHLFFPVIMSKNFKQRLYTVDVVIAFIAQHNYGGAVLYKPCEHAVVATPPPIVINDLFTGRIAEHPPTKTIILYAGLFKTIRCKS